MEVTGGILFLNVFSCFQDSKELLETFDGDFRNSQACILNNFQEITPKTAHEPIYEKSIFAVQYASIDRSNSALTNGKLKNFSIRNLNRFSILCN